MIYLTLEKKTEAINAYLINTHMGEVGEKLDSHNRSDGWDNWGWGGLRDRERYERLSTGLPLCWRKLVAQVSLVSKQS